MTMPYLTSVKLALKRKQELLTLAAEEQLQGFLRTLLGSDKRGCAQVEMDGRREEQRIQREHQRLADKAKRAAEKDAQRVAQREEKEK